MPRPAPTPLVQRLDRARSRLARLSAEAIEARVTSAAGVRASIGGMARFLAVGDRLSLFPREGPAIPAEVIGASGEESAVMLYRHATGLGAGARARMPLVADGGSLDIGDDWIGRVVDPLGQPLDGRGALGGGAATPVRRQPLPAAERARLGAPIELGVRAMDLFATCREGQRLGLFAGAGVGKSTLLGMLARWAAFDVIVVALVGERGREVREFLEDDLGDEGRRRAVVVVATSDAPALLRREAMHAAMAAAEHFRDRGRRVLLLADSLTRFCHAVREVALTNAELPVARGYPPSVFAELASLLERAGPGREGGAGSITAFFTVLVDGDDTTEPVADAVRGILDGHVILGRAIAERGRYPAVDVLRSLSRAATAIHPPERNELLRQARQVMAEAEDVEQLARLGVIRPGSDPAVDRALALNRRIGAFLHQDTHTRHDREAGFAGLAELIAES